MHLRLIFGLIALVGVSTCGLISTIVFYEMVDKVNQKLPKADHFSLLWWYLPKALSLCSHYKKLYPDGTLSRRFYFLCFLSFASLLVSAWCLILP